MNRAVAVHQAFIRTALENVYKVPGIAGELGIQATVKNTAR